MSSKYQSDIFMAIADPNRRYILTLLVAGTLSINTLAAEFTISRPAVSKHIRILEEAGMVSVKKSGRERYCELNPDGFSELRDWLDFYEKFWDEKMKNLGKLLAQRKPTKSII